MDFKIISVKHSLDCSMNFVLSYRETKFFEVDAMVLNGDRRVPIVSLSCVPKEKMYDDKFLKEGFLESYNNRLNNEIREEQRMIKNEADIKWCETFVGKIVDP